MKNIRSFALAFKSTLNAIGRGCKEISPYFAHLSVALHPLILYQIQV